MSGWTDGWTGTTAAQRCDNSEVLIGSIYGVERARVLRVAVTGNATVRLRAAAIAAVCDWTIQP